MKFPHPCGQDYADAAARGVDPKAVVPDDHIIVHGGTAEIPPPGTKFSGAAGPTLEAAGVAVPHGQVRTTTAGAIRVQGGTVTWEPQLSRWLTPNPQHVNIVEGGAATSFSEPVPNPVPRRDRIDANRK